MLSGRRRRSSSTDWRPRGGSTGASQHDALGSAGAVRVLDDERRDLAVAEGGDPGPHTVHDFNYFLEDGHHFPVVLGAAIHVRALPLFSDQAHDLLQLLFLRLAPFIRRRVRIAAKFEGKKKIRNAAANSLTYLRSYIGASVSLIYLFANKVANI